MRSSILFFGFLPHFSGSFQFLIAGEAFIDKSLRKAYHPTSKDKGSYLWRERRREMKKGFLISFVLLFGFLQGAAMGADKVTLRLNWNVYGEHAGFFYGLERGFYKDEGIDLTIGVSQGSGQTVKLIGTKNDPFGYADAATVAKHISEGMEVKMLGVMLQTNPQCVITWADKHPLKKPQDIKGLAFSFVAGDSLHQLWPAIIAGAGLKETDVRTVFAPSAMTKIQMMLQGKVDGTPGYITMQPYLLERDGGRKTSTMMFEEFGVNTMSQGILAHVETLQKNPDLAKRFMRATQKSWVEAAKNIDAAVEAHIKHNPKEDAKFTKYTFSKSLDVVTTKHSKGKPFGWMAKEDWEQTLTVLEKYGGMKGRKAAEAYYTNEFVQ
jgi:NitT/TauT family transport system substrate-binding protein